jgi:hypothetical protein
MCWSKNVSLYMGLVGIVASYVAYFKIEKLWAFNIFFFAIMQFIHWLGYLVINDCKNPLNKAMSYANYLHVCFQPFVWTLGFYGLFSKFKIITPQQLKNYWFVIQLSFLASLNCASRIFSIKMSKDFMFPTINKKHHGCAYCGKTCSFSGKEHIGFSLPLRIAPEYLTTNHFYHFMFLFLPLLFFNGITRLIAFVTFITAMIPGFIYKTEATESAALWCTLTIFQLLLTAYIIMR